MNKEEIRHFKSLLRQGILRHKSILLDDKFQSELLNIIKGYEQLQQENKQLKDNWNMLKVYIKTEIPEDVFIDTEWFISILDKMHKLEQGSDSND